MTTRSPKHAPGNARVAIARSITIASILAMPLALVALAMPAAAREKLPEVTHDGLHLVEGTGFEAFYMKPGASLGGYDELKIIECFVAFKKHWQQEQQLQYDQYVSARQMDQIKKTLSAEFHKVFVKQMQDKGPYKVVDEVGPSVLIIRPAIINLDIEGAGSVDQPDETTFAASAGQMTLYMELYDSVTSDLIARVIDAEADQNAGSIYFRNEVTNMAAADQILRRWADRLRAMLEKAHAHPGAAGDAKQTKSDKKNEKKKQ